jgi:mono/diheme cytochrome c family protein
MLRVLRFLMFGVLGIVGVVALAVGGLYVWSNGELSATVPQPTHDFTAPNDAAAVARGEHVVRSLAKCVDCHANDLGGSTVIDDPAFAVLFGPNLTTGRGGILAGYSDAALERAIRHGIARDGRRLMVMPSNEYQYLSDDDVGAIIAYLRTVAPVDRDPVETTVGPIARALYAKGDLPLFPFEGVTHGEESVPAVPIDSTVEYGRYLGTIGCSGCHGATYGGGKIPGTPPDWPPPANLTPTGIGHYTYTDFQRALRDGVRPDGSAINPFMPIAATKQMSEVEFAAIWKYLRTLEPKEFGAR